MTTRELRRAEFLEAGVFEGVDVDRDIRHGYLTSTAEFYE